MAKVIGLPCPKVSANDAPHWHLLYSQDAATLSSLVEIIDLTDPVNIGSMCHIMSDWSVKADALTGDQIIEAFFSTEMAR